MQSSQGACIIHMDVLGNPSMYSWFIKKFTIDFSCLKSSVAREAIGLLFAIEHYEKWLHRKVCPCQNGTILHYFVELSAQIYYNK